MSMTERQPKRVGVAVLTHRPTDHLVACLRSVLDSQFRPTQVVVVDSGTPTTSADPLDHLPTGVELLRLEDNLGYGAGMNAAAARLISAGCDQVLFLTHEVVLEPGSIGELSAALANLRPGGAVGPLLGRLSDPSRIWSAGGEMSRVRSAPRHRRTGELLSSRRGMPQYDVRWLDGACLMIDAESFRAVGGFREDLFLYFEDVDLALRLAKVGRRVVCVPAAVAFQEPSMTPPYLAVRNRALALGRRGAFAGWLEVGLRAGTDPFRGRGCRRAVLSFRGMRDAREGRLDSTLALERPGSQ